MKHAISLITCSPAALEVVDTHPYTHTHTQEQQMRAHLNAISRSAAEAPLLADMLPLRAALWIINAGDKSILKNQNTVIS